MDNEYLTMAEIEALVDLKCKGGEKADGYKVVMDGLRIKGMVQDNLVDLDEKEWDWELTTKGHRFLQMLEETPLPVLVWSDPREVQP